MWAGLTCYPMSPAVRSSNPVRRTLVNPLDASRAFALTALGEPASFAEI